MKKRALQIVLVLVMVLFFVERFTPVHAASCETKMEKKSEKTVELSGHGTVSDEPSIAFVQQAGGDEVFRNGLRDAFKEELARRMPKARFVDGPPGKDSVSLRMTLTAYDARWTPLYSHEAFTGHTAIQLPNTRATAQITADGSIDSVCKGLVSKSHAESHVDTLAPFAAYLVDQLEQAQAKK